MRMIDRVHREERGAAITIVAISLVVLLGMLVLTADVGSMVAAKRSMVRSADSAALAAAQACAGSAAQSPGTAESYADQYAIANADMSTLNSGAVNIVEYGAIVPAAGGGFTYVPGVDNCQNGQPGYVVVEYTGTQDLLFAGIFGASQGDVAATATAIWATTTNAGIVPWVVTLPTWIGCDGADPYDPALCTFEFPPPPAANPDWGIMDWTTWAAPPDDGTPLSVNECGVSSGGPTWDPIWAGEVRLNPSPVPPNPPHWVCFDNGLQWSNDWEMLEGGTWAFPIASVINDNQPPDADMGQIVNLACASVPVGGVVKQGNRVFITLVPEDVCYFSGDVEPVPGMGIQGARLVE